MKTKTQIEREKKHSRVVELYLQLSACGGSKTAMWNAIEKKVHYTPMQIKRILKANGIDYNENRNNNELQTI